MSNDLSGRFRRFAEHECTGRVGTPSPLYEHLSLEIANDPELLALAENARDDQPTPNLLFAAVQYLLYEHPVEPLTRWYPSVGRGLPIDDDTYPTFREFCQRYESEILHLIRGRRVQTNVVRRSACLLPAFERVSRLASRAPLGLVEVGPSAGLNLLWDEYGYDYGNGVSTGKSEAPVQIECETRGNLTPPIPENPPEVGSRCGIDLHPVDPRNKENVRWLKALIWPEHEYRRTLVENAIKLSEDNPPELIEGDVLSHIEPVVEEIPPDQTLCLYNTHVLYQMSDTDRKELYELVSAIARSRDVYWISCEWALDVAIPKMHMYRFESGIHSGELLATYHGHGSWLQWLRRTCQDDS